MVLKASMRTIELNRLETYVFRSIYVFKSKVISHYQNSLRRENNFKIFEVKITRLLYR